jgi:hypothetical protein
MAAGGDPEFTRVASLNAMPPSPHSAPGRETCDSCGAPADDIAPVHRVYVTPGAWDLTSQDEAAADRVDVLDEVERWCFPCRSQYPHQPLAG